MKTVDYSFREKLNRMLGGFSHNYCYQCGACVPDCPAHRYFPEFNPRIIILKALFGMEEELTGKGSVIWNCTNCFNCYERCPQAVRPIEVIVALKNIAREKGTDPPAISSIIDRAKGSGSTVALTQLSLKRRQELNLPEYHMDCLDDLKKIFQQ